MSLEEHFNPLFAATLALREKQIQQHYRPVIGIHKWFARRPGSVFRTLLLAEFQGQEALEESYWHAHAFHGVIADPFMGGGTPLFEANRPGFSVVGTDINPMAYWIVRQSFGAIDPGAFGASAAEVAADVEAEIGAFYRTRCVICGHDAIVKYALWVKVETCPHCGSANDLFPSYLLATATRHPRYVLVCGACGTLNECEQQPTAAHPTNCVTCGHALQLRGPAQRQRIRCPACNLVYPYPAPQPLHPPQHRLWALEYHCQVCKPARRGRFFKQPDTEDLARFAQACARLLHYPDLPIPDNDIPAGDETNRLRKWGYQRYRQLFNERQLLGLGLLLRRICTVEPAEIRHALLTVFSDVLRYQNMVCRYDTSALKCQDIFSIHGFPVGLLQCENNLLGIPGVGAGVFRHFVEKYRRAKRYCQMPFETRYRGRRRETVFISGEHLHAHIVNTFPNPYAQEAYLRAAPAPDMPLAPASLDGVFTDPPYFDNVQYAELMDFCFCWLRLGLQNEFEAFSPTTTRSFAELTGNSTLGRGIAHFTEGLSAIFCHYSAALKPGAPFVFTYHHNDPLAYVPLAVALLDAGMNCSATLPAVAEMQASLHLCGTASSVVDSVFVCRAGVLPQVPEDLERHTAADIRALRSAGLQVSEGDMRCLAAGHIARMVINRLFPTWNAQASLHERMGCVREGMVQRSSHLRLQAMLSPLEAQR
ncbi:MAG TPA: hypothetical protein VGF67_26065 [Ktedonobacteraceae bacterium]